jgi:hypothetical protein
MDLDSAAFTNAYLLTESELRVSQLEYENAELRKEVEELKKTVREYQIALLIR